MNQPTILHLLLLECFPFISKNSSILLNGTTSPISIVQHTKKRYLSYAFAVVGVLFFMSHGMYGQVLKPFTKSYDENIKGDILVIGNNILNRDFGTSGNRANDPYNATGTSSVYNESTNMKWINIDPDGSKNFNSSSAKLIIPPASQSCYKIVYAALYWSGTYSISATNGSASGADRSKINKVRFKVGSNPYVDLVGNVIYDYVGVTGTSSGPLAPATAQSARNPYACMIDVSNYVKTGGETTYTVANIASSEGGNGTSAGHSAGWSLFVVYEDPKLPGKYVTTYNGFTRIRSGDPAFTFSIDGFRTIPTGPVKAKLAFAALEGDNRDARDYLDIKGATIAGSINERLSTPTIRPIASGTPNFFNSSISNGDTYFSDRVPNSINTLGYDTGILTLSNPSNNTIKNTETRADITLGTGSDWYYLFFTAMAVDIIEPEIILSKVVLDKNDKDIGGANVTFNDVLNYVIRFQNVGNDDAQNFTIEDTLPINVTFNYPADITKMPAGVKVKSYDPTTRLLVFDVDKSLVKVNAPFQEIRLRVQVVSGCNALSNACSNSIDNIAIAKYTGTVDPTAGTVLSVNSNNQCLAEPKATNFLVGIDGCVYQTDVTLCGESTVLTAGNGYNKYEWSTSPFDSNGIPTGPIIATNQSFTITDVGTYYVRNTAIAPCRSITQQFNVTRFGGVVANPIVPFADEVVICPNDGKQLPNIYLCGSNDFRSIKTGITNTTSIIWQKLTGGCASVPNPTCASESATCTWTQVATGPDFSADSAGEYRLILNYNGGCFNRFYFNVYKNSFNPTAESTDIFCSKPGSITITNPPLGSSYEYSLSPTGPFVASNTFAINTAGTYTAYVRQIGVTSNPCIFSVPNLQVLNRDIAVQEIIQQPFCKGDLGQITLNVNNVRAQYYLKVYKGSDLVANLGPQNTNQFLVNNLSVGSYTYTVTTDDLCTKDGSFSINDPTALTAKADLTKPLTCEDGEFLVSPNGGTGPYVFFVNGSTSFQSTLTPYTISRPLPTGGVYNIKVVDANNCETTTSIIVTDNPKPEFTVTKTDVLCYGANSGAINFNVTNANGYTLAYSIDNGTTYVANGAFTNLVPGTYTPILRYSLGGVDCFDPQPAVTITEPAEALSASAGVSELAGCGVPNKGDGKVRITNPQGGVPPYEFSFDNQATWTATNDAYKAPGTYTLYVKDANGCIFGAPVTLDPEPPAPVISATPQIDFNCDGTATSTVTVQNPPSASYTYEYFLNGVKNTNVPNNVFVNVPSGTYSIRVDYKLNAVPTPSNLLFENFGYGADTQSPGINTTFYCFERQVDAFKCKSSIVIEDGDYSVTARIVQPYGAWIQPGDHTPPTVPPTPKGRCLVVNLGDKIATTDVIYKKVIKDIIPNQPINFELYVKNLLRKGNGQIDCNLAVALVDATGVEISTFTTGDVPKSELWEKYPKTPITLDPKNNTTLTFIIRSNKSNTNGNDVAIDDIRVYQLPRTCIASKTFPLVIDAGKAFTAQITGTKNITCNGLTNGEITIAAQNFDAVTGYQYSLDNGTNWSTALTTSPYTITDLAPNTYTVAIRPVGSAITACTKTFPPVNITQPNPIVVNATATAATCTTGARITTTVTGGTPAYQYQLRQVIAGVEAATPVVDFNNNPAFNNIGAGEYRIYVRDANGCATTVGFPITITAPPALTAALATTTDYCYTTANPARLDVEVTSGTGPFTYKLDGNAAVSSAATTYSFTNVAPGTHTILVTDSNNCTATISSIVIAPQIGFTVSLINDLTCLADATIGNPVVTGGNPGVYSYTVTHGGTTTAATFPYTATTHGTYVFTVTDSKGCPATSNTITVTAKTNPTITTSKTDITCNNANDGTITVTASGGFTSAYTYEIAGPVTISQTTNKFTGLSAGDYDVRVIDSKGCPSLPVRVTIVNPTALVVSASATTFSCSATNTKQSATVTIDVPTTGTAPYKYSFNGGSFTNTNTLVVNDNGTDQTINYAVRDASNCVTTGSIILNKLNPPTIATISNTPIYCAPATSTTSTVTVPVTAGTGVAPLAYTIVSGPVTNTTGATTGIFSGLTAGTYVFRVTDANGCYVTKSHNVPVLTPIAVTTTKLTDVDCFGIPTGSARFTVSNSSGGPGSYTVVTSPVIPPAQIAISGNVYTITGLANGTYTFSVTDNTTGCTDSKSVTITQPAAALDVTIVSNKNANCNIATARVEVLAAGGTPNYRYSFVTSDVTPGAYGNSPIANLNPTTSTSWYAHVIDAKGCTFVLPITIATDPTPTVTATAAGQCLGVGTFTITANNTTPAAGIVTPITYSLNGGTFQAGDTFTVTASGDYIVRMKDGNGCIATAPKVTVVPQLTLNAVLNKDITCNPAPTAASITLIPTGGSGSFTYTASPNTGIFAGTVFTTSVPGSYTFTVTDTVTGCTYTTTTAIDVTTPINPDITGVTQTAFINCNGDDTAAIAIAIDNTKGQSPFVFNVRQYSDPAHTILVQDFGTQTSGLPAGYYVITVNDAKGCTDTETITITEPDPIVIDFDTEDLKCTDDGTGTNIVKGKIIINSVTGGSPSYNYYVTGINGYNDERLNITGAAFFDIVDFGLYQIRVVDANGCSALVSNVKIASPPDELVIDVNTSATCAGGSAEVKIGTALASTGPFRFAVYTGAGQTYTPPTTLPWQDEDAPNSKKTTFTGLIPGVTYTFIVYDDATDCYYFQTADTAIPSTTNLAINNFVPNNITCTSANDGNVSFDIFNGNAYSVDVNYQVYEDFTNLLITGVGGTATIAVGGTHNVLNLGTLPVGSYYVLVQETSGANAGCSAISAPFNIKKSPVELSIIANVIKNVNCNEDGIISVQAKDGTAPYTYQYLLATDPAPTAGTAGWISATTFATSTTGNYVVYVKDAYGCIKSDGVILLQDALPTITAAPPAICYDGSTAFTLDLSTVFSATILPATYKVVPSASSGTIAYQSGATFTFNAADTYRLFIKDGNGCEAFVDYVVRPQLQLSPSLTKELDCNLPTPNATVTVTASGGSGAGSYTYTITAGAVGNTTGSTTGIFTGLDAGNYTFEVNDGSCTATATFTIDPIPTTVLAAPTVTDVSCNGGSDGTITVNVTSGEGPYEYSLTDGVTTTPFQTSNQFPGLAAGTTYVVTVRNAKQCTLASSPITIAEPSALSATSVLTTPLSCGAGNIAQTATVTVTGMDGTAPYEYSFDNGVSYSTTNTYQSNVGITFNVLVKDAKGCVFTLVNGVDIPALVPPTDLVISTIVPDTCTADATVDITGHTGGVGVLQYETIAPSPIIIAPQTTTTFAGLTPGTYVFQVTDANGCTYQESFTVDPVTNITVAASATTDVTCFGFANGTATFDVANFGGAFSTVINPAVPFTQTANQVTLSNLAPNTYIITVTDATTGCTATATVTISQPAAALDFTPTATRINCNNDEATITVLATGGTPTYKYAVLQSPSTAPAATAYGLSNLLTVDTNGGTNMVWDVYVMDANGCVDFDDVTIQTDANPIITSANHTPCVSASGTYDITVIATGFNLPSFQYSADGSNYQTGNVITVNAPGNYTIYVKDANGCVSVGFPITILDPLILTPTVTTPVSCATNDGVVSVNTTGGSGNYVYNIDGSAWTTTTPFTNVSSGPHIIGVKDINTTCEVFATVNLQAATPITGFALTKTDVTCNTGNDGTITATMDTPTTGVNDNPVYEYSINGGAFDPSPLFTGLVAGTYTVDVRSARGCPATATITIGEPAQIIVPTIIPVQFACTTGNTGNLATITVDPTLITGGSGTYLNYEFIKVGTPNTVVQFGNNNVYTEANLSGGSYIVNVYDDKGCIGTSTASITIAPFVQLDKVNVVVDQAITCTNLENITVTATTIGAGTTNLEYTLLDESGAPVFPTNTTGDFTGLTIGNYLIKVRNLDTNCEIIGVHYVNNPDTFDLTIDNVVDVTCLNDTNGSARVTLIDRVPTPVDNAGPFTYTVFDIANPLVPVVVVPSTSSPTAGPINLTGLRAGTFMITATLNQAPSCTVSKNFTITGPNELLQIIETHTEITCVAGNNDGSISATATGGWPGGYEFRLEETLAGTVVSDWSTTSTFNGLTAGNYVVKVRDSRGCEVFRTVVLTNPTPIAFTTTTTNATLLCKGDTNATITVSAPTGGQGTNYLYTLNTISANPVISSGPQANPVFTNLGAGTYTVTVTDGWGCGTTSAPIVINEPTEVVASLVLASTQTCLTQSTLTLSATGGTGTYEYSTTPNFAVVADTFATSITFPVPVGTYRYYVRDANGCTSIVSNDITIEPIPTLQVALDVQNAKINCKGDTNGVIVATATGGLGNYVYTLLDGAGNPVAFTPVQTTPGNFTQLPAGTYSVRVASGDCQAVSVSEVIEEPLLALTASAVVTPVTCSGAANGIITVTASGGTGAIKYAISPRLDQFFDTGVFDQLAPDTYQIIVQDENGCFVLLSETITEPQPIFVNTVAGSEIQEVCFGDNDAAFDINITGGVAPYSVSIDNINGTYVTGAATQNVFAFTGLTGGDHTVYIKDANGCTAEWLVALDPSVNLDPKVTVDYGCDNNAPSNTVTVSLDASVDATLVDYALDGSTVFQTSNVFKNVAPGPHTITARHANSCEKTTTSFEVIGYAQLTLSLADGGLNEIVANAAGGAGNYQYSFDGGNTFDTNNKFIFYKSGEYTVIVRDANGCEATATRYFEFIDIKIPNVFTPNGDGNNDTWFPTNTINYKDLTISIFDRYGRKVASLREGQGWDGKYNSLELPTGDYWYILKLRNTQDDREFVGHFTLMR